LKIASQVSELKGFDLKVSFFETVSSPIDYVKDFSFYEMGDTYEANAPLQVYCREGKETGDTE